MSLPRPCSAIEAVNRALSIAGHGGQYELGTGDYSPINGVDLPWTSNGKATGSDCAGFAISWCYKLKRHRPGYNQGSWASVSDDLNVNSALEDAQHTQDLFTLVTDKPTAGDLLCYPTFDSHGLHFIGHVGLVINAGLVFGETWDPVKPRYDLLYVAQCHGPNGHAPGVTKTDGSIWSHHDSIWPLPQHRTHVIRAKP